MLGAEWRPQAGRGQALFELNGFYTGLRDLFFARENDDPTTDAFEFLKVNQGDARVYGMEANAGWGIGDELVLQGGVVFQRARYAEPEPNFGSPDFFRTPNRYANLTLTWTTARLGTVFTGVRYTGSMKAPSLCRLHRRGSAGDHARFRHPRREHRLSDLRGRRPSAHRDRRRPQSDQRVSARS
jgi:outer membrane receptor for ferrienterochelin and colicins